MNPRSVHPGLLAALIAAQLHPRGGGSCLGLSSGVSKHSVRVHGGAACSSMTLTVVGEVLFFTLSLLSVASSALAVDADGW